MHILNKLKDTGSVVFIDLGNNREYPAVSDILLDYLDLSSSTEYIDIFDLLKERGCLEYSFVDNEHKKGYYIKVKTKGKYYKEVVILGIAKCLFNGVILPAIVAFITALITALITAA